jgi:3-hydroxyacyl-[acyl-carrier-protein] dehydratase
MTSQAEEGVLRAIPHREPFLFIDKVIAQAEASIRVERTIRADEPHFAGHYPGNPIMPGVLLCELCFQAGAILLAARARDTEAGGGTPVLARIENARFKQIVRPGDRLEAEITWKEALSAFHFLEGRCLREGKVVMSVRFALTLASDA